MKDVKTGPARAKRANAADGAPKRTRRASPQESPVSTPSETPTAPLASVAEVATARPRSGRGRANKSAPQPATAARASLSAVASTPNLFSETVEPKASASPEATDASPRARTFRRPSGPSAPDLPASLRDAVTESAAATTRGFAELNGKMFDALRIQADATFALWRSTLTAGSLSEAVRVQTSGFRQAYETTTGQWKDLTDTATRVAGEAVRPLRSALSDRED